jgi:hypothetical protein
VEPFSLLGGPLHRIGRRLGLVRETETVRLGLALGVGLWMIIVVLSVMEGATDRLFRWSVVAGHVRLLVVIPLFFVAESWVAPRMTSFLTTIVGSGVVPPGATAALLDGEVVRANRLTNAWQPEAIWLLMAIGLEVTGTRLLMYGATEVSDSSRVTLAAMIYFRVGVTLFRFLVFRWAWKLTVWSWVLWRVSRLDLQLIPGHPDHAGGLGTIETVHERFTPLVAAFSIVQCASLAESVSTGTIIAGRIYPWLTSWMTLVMLIDGALFILPLLVFTDKMRACRARGVGQYMSLATQYVTAFEAKWTHGTIPEDAILLGNEDVQSKVALDEAVHAAKEMRSFPVGRPLLSMLAVAAIVPFAPLLLFQYHITHLTQTFFSKLIGL